MNKRIYFLLLALVVFSGLTSCDIIEGDQKCYECIQSGSNKKILLEDFTGHYCGNCPKSHHEAEFLDSLYHDTTIIVLNLHGGAWFSAPHPALGFTADYRTKFATDLDSVYHAEGTEGYPIGMVNRRVFNSNILVKYSDFGTRIASVLSDLPGGTLEVTSAYDAGTNSTNIAVNTELFNNYSSGVSLNVLIKEDSIISPQEDYDEPDDVIEDYVHMHMCRYAVTSGLWGEMLSANVSQGDFFTRNYTVALDTAWVPAHCSVVAFLRDNSNGEVLQAAEIKLVP